MKFACERCRRRFSTVDEPIAGRVYYIPCKCGHVVALRTDAAGALEPLPPRATAAVPPPLPPSTREADADPAWVGAQPTRHVTGAGSGEEPGVAAEPGADVPSPAADGDLPRAGGAPEMPLVTGAIEIPQATGAVEIPPVAGAAEIPQVTGAILVEDDPFAGRGAGPLPPTRAFDLAALAAGEGPPRVRLDPTASPEELVDTRMYDAATQGRPTLRWPPPRAAVLAAGAATAFAVAVGAWVSVVSGGTTSLTIARSPHADPPPLLAAPATTFDLAAPAAPLVAAPAQPTVPRFVPSAEPVAAPELIRLATGADEHPAMGDAPVAPEPILAAEPPPAAAAREPAPADVSPAAPRQAAPEGSPAAAARASARAPDARQVFEALRGHGGDLDECIAGAPDAVPAIAGKRFRLVVVVDPDGRVSDAAVDDPAVDATALGTCLRGVAYAMSFQPFEGGPARVRVPLKPDEAQ